MSDNKTYQIDPPITDKKRLNWHKSKVLGQPLRQISEETGQSIRQISYDIADIQYYIQGSEEFQKVGDKIIKMIPKSLAVYDNKLDDNDLLAARDVMKWIGIHVERTKLSGNVDVNNMSNEELAKSIIELALQAKKADDEKIEPQNHLAE
jgi:hypothetical protein